MDSSGLIEHGGNVYSAMRQSGKLASQFLDFSANINPLGLAETVRQAIIQSVNQVVHYPDANAEALKSAISDFYNVSVQAITPGNGAVEMLYVLCNVIRPERVLVTAPAFSEYERAARAARAEIKYYFLAAEKGFAICIEELIQSLPGVRIVFIGNPNNPTGAVLRQADIEKLLASARLHNVYVVVDESFLDFMPNDSEYTCRPLLSKYDNLAIIHSMTKFYAIPGLRLGFALASPELTQRLHESKDPWNVNTLAQNAGVVALQDLEYRQSSKNIVGAARQVLYQRLLDLPGVKPFEPTVNFVLCDIGGTGFTASQLREKAMEHGILIRDCSNFPGLSTNYIRVAVRSPEQNSKLLDVLKTVLESKRD